jgi:hypothetical protein
MGGRGMTSDTPRFSTRSRDLLALGAIALGYAITHQLGFRFMSRTAGVAAVWPASGVALAALLLNARRLWPSLLAVLGAISLLSNLERRWQRARAIRSPTCSSSCWRARSSAAENG